MNFTQLKEQLEEIMSSWNGKESGLAEERAGYALEALEQLEELENTLEELGLIKLN